jgi:hypothetical protein
LLLLLVLLLLLLLLLSWVLAACFRPTQRGLDSFMHIPCVFWP